MNRGIYSTAAAMLGAQRQLDTIANNLANVSTTGYKRDELAFGDTLSKTIRANGGYGEILGEMSFGTAAEREYTAFEKGSIQATGSPFDFAIDSAKGLFAVLTPEGRKYTRDGAFELTADGVLITREKFPVLDERGNPIQIPVGEMIVGQDGSITVDGKAVGQLAVYDGAFVKSGANLYSSSDAQAMDDPQVRWKSIESSNVNAVEAMVDMVQLQRRFDLAQRTIQQQDELAQRLIQSLNQS